MHSNSVPNRYVEEQIEHRRDLPIGRDVPEAYWLHSPVQEGQVGLGSVLAVLLVVLLLVAVASTSDSVTLVLLR